MITIKEGLDLPLAGNPDQVIHDDVTVKEVALVGPSWNNLKPSMRVREGEQVEKGQVLFVDKKNPSVTFVSPVKGKVKAVHRGEKRSFQSLVLELDSEQPAAPALGAKPEFAGRGAELKQKLLDNGLWVGLRTRPFSNIANPEVLPHSLFVNAHNTHPGHASVEAVLAQDGQAFDAGLEVLAEIFKDVEHKFVVSGAALKSQVKGFTYEQFAGPHPAGLVGTHIHKLAPVTLQKVAYHINYSDVVQIGKFFLAGEVYDGTKVVALSGPQVKAPTLYRVPYGACVTCLTANKLKDSQYGNRIISGSVLDGHTAVDAFAYVGHFDLQVSVIEEGLQQEFLGWVLPQPKKFSLSRLSIFGKKDLALTTTQNGSARAQVPIGLYERVMPLDIFPTLLLRDLLSNDTDSAQDLGALELAEDDLALCTLVCQGKYDYGTYLRQALNKIEKEG